MVEYNIKLFEMYKKRGFTQAKLSEKVKMTKTIVSYVVLGRWKLTEDEKKLFAKALKCKVPEIF